MLHYYFTKIVKLEFHCPLISPQISAKFMSFGEMNLCHQIISVVKSNGIVTVK